MKTFVTIGIPTHRRPKFLKRAINKLLKKKNNFKIIVSVDGIDETYNEYVSLEKKYKRFKNLIFFYHKKNIGSINNFFFLRKACKTKYFMWLADDDLIDVDTINNLFQKILKSKDICTVVPYWQLHNYNKKKLIKPSFFDSDNIFLRVLKYSYNSDDAFFYGLHDIKYLKNCEFNGYFWPNQTVLSNWCYVFQMDLVIQGKILFLNNKKYKWINHDYGKKFYDKGPKGFFKRITAYFLRKCNIYLLYLYKLIKWNKFIIFFVMLFIFPMLLLRDLIFREPSYHKVQLGVKRT